MIQQCETACMSSDESCLGMTWLHGISIKGTLISPTLLELIVSDFSPFVKLKNSHSEILSRRGFSHRGKWVVFLPVSIPAGSEKWKFAQSACGRHARFSTGCPPLIASHGQPHLGIPVGRIVHGSCGSFLLIRNEQFSCHYHHTHCVRPPASSPSPRLTSLPEGIEPVRDAGSE
jgi:hypothetical protein